MPVDFYSDIYSDIYEGAFVPTARPTVQPFPDLTLTVAGRVVRAEGISAGASLGGYDSLGAVVSSAELLSFGSPVEQGTDVDLWASGNRWSGVLSLDPQFNPDGTANISAIGHKDALASMQERRLYQTRDVSEFQDENDSPHEYFANEDIDAQNTEAGLLFATQAGDTLGSGANHAMVAWFEDCVVTRVAFDWATNFTNAVWDVNLLAGMGPSGSMSNEGSPQTLSVATGSKDRTLADIADQIAISLRTNSAVANSPRRKLRVKNVRINGIASGDSFQWYEVLQDMGAGVGFDTSGVSVSSGLNILPFDHQEGAWDEALVYVCDLADAWCRVLDDRGNGPYLESDTWANSRIWKLRQSDGVVCKLTPEPRYSKVRVKWKRLNGRTRQTFEPTGIDLATERILDFELPDVQADNTLATQVATNLASWAGTKRFSGQLEVPHAWLDGRDDPSAILPGDKALIEDWGPGESLELKVTETSLTSDMMTLGVEGKPASASSLVQRWDLRHARKRQPVIFKHMHKHPVGHWDRYKKEQRQERHEKRARRRAR